MTHSGDFLSRGMNTVDALAVEDQITSLNLYINGDCDRIRELPTAILGELLGWEAIEGNDLSHMHAGVYNAVYYYGLYCPLPVFGGSKFGPEAENARKLRRALALSIDRKKLVEVVTRGGQAPAYRLVPGGVAGYSDRACFGTGDYAKDLAEARRLVKEVREAGVEIPALKILYNTHEAHSKIAVFIQSIWREQLGIDIEPTNQEWGVYLDSRRTGNFEICRAGWIGDYTDPNTFLDLFVEGGQNNDPKYDNPHYDRIVKQYSANTLKALETPEARAALLKDVRSWHAYDRVIRAVKRPDGRGLDESLEAALEGYDRLESKLRLEATFAIRLLLFEIAEEMLLWDMPTIPIYHYTTTQLWPPELEGIGINSRDVHPLKTLRWTDGQRPAGSRYQFFSSLPTRSPIASP